MDFYSAELGFRRLEELRKAGQIDKEQYRLQLDQLQVTDASGRSWKLQELTGHWYVLDRGKWHSATPPRPAAAAAPPGPSPTAVSAAQQSPEPVPSRSRATARQRRRSRPGCVGIMLRLLLWALFWAGAAWALDSLVRTTPLWAYPALGLGALLTLVLWVRWMTRHGRAARKGAQGGLP